MGARPYNPADGRFIQVDLIAGGCANLYTYAFGDPLNHPDLSGQVTEGAAGGGPPAIVCQKVRQHHPWWETALAVAGVVAGVAVAAAFAVATAGVGAELLAAYAAAVEEGGAWGAFEVASIVSKGSFVILPAIGGAGVGLLGAVTASIYIPKIPGWKCSEE